MALDHDRRRILAGLDDAQREAVTCADNPLLVLAGAGSGKTRVLSRRIAWRATGDDSFGPHVLALTFTRKAATELRQRLRGLGHAQPVLAGTFHAVALNELRRRASDLGRAAPVVLDARSRLLGAAAQRAGIAELAPTPLRRAVEEIGWAKARLIPPTHYREEASRCGRGREEELAAATQLYEAYELEKHRRGVLDLDDLLPRLVEEMRGDVDFAASQRWRFRHFFVDELQDANPAQLALLDCWVDGRADLFGVGDPNQAIYGWNGAEPTAVTAFNSRYGGVRVIRLEANYRSTPEIIAVAGAVLADRPQPPSSPRASGARPSVAAYPDADAEARAVATAVRRQYRGGHQWSEIAVLARTNAQLDVLADALHRAGVPLRNNAPRLLAQPAPRAALRMLAAARDSAVLRDQLNELRTPATSSPADVGGSVPLDDWRQLLVELGRTFLELEPTSTGPSFVDFVRETLATDGDPRGAAGVALLTFHRAKGLEWPVVFVTGLEDGLSPIAHARTAPQVDEERRLLYVALSRAEDELYCSWARQRGGRGDRIPSPFLGALEACCATFDARNADVGAARRALAECRATLGEVHEFAGR
jgi:DNA helicase-2/ATP-dependent DNA helicase PcrA